MVNICHNAAAAAEKYGVKGNYVVGANIAFAPSATAITPLATSAFASSKSNSFCVAHGSAISTFTLHTPLPS